MKRIFHIGVGNFFRAHQAVFTQGLAGWEIVGASLRSPHMAEALAAQGGAYTLAVKDRSGTQFQKIDVLKDVLVAPRDPDAALQRIADPATVIVTITVTENGYCLAPDGTLDLSNEGVALDLDTGAAVTLPALLARGLARRRKAKAGPITVMSCDNLAENGRKLGAAVKAFAKAAGLDADVTAPDFVRFPNAMVDRITPATTDALRQEVADQTGWADAAPVETEAFAEWVIEDDFAGPRPDWERSGAVFVEDVAPFEMRKLRMLNGAHSYLAYTGQMAGHTYVHEAIADPELRADVRNLFSVVQATLPVTSARDADAYGRALVERFENPGLKHELAQIAQDGSLKIPIRWGNLPRHGRGMLLLSKGLSAWVAWVCREVAAGRPVQDPSAARIAEVCKGCEIPEGAVPDLLGLIFPESEATLLVGDVRNAVRHVGVN
ncbi:Polyol:NADP oxidoreductase [Shimia sp. SK013]|uniref:mannitol dehydrogenase family protein n=1 Tax=Shimia sp. SK013 TaxID=1389006 RepID=UPI0006B40D32|nr:mannitol dehydrogenase family protein [Shimia sp. SK013]KPA23206.1 Polyol:NADP oxidoreductase [Shimia sp. SK013]